MINDFKKIGHSILSNSGFFNNNMDIIEKRKSILLHQTLKPYIKKDKNGKSYLNGCAICINFDLEKKEFEFKLSNKELTEENREYFFAFKLGAPKDRKKFLSTNNLNSFYDVIFKEIKEYILDKTTANKSKNWFKENISKEYFNFISKILEDFYKDDKKIYLNYELLNDKQKKEFLLIKEKNNKNNISDLYNRLVNKLYFDTDSKNTKYFSSISMILFNGKTILEYDNGKFKADYINLCYYDLLKRFSIEKSKKNKICHVCGEQKTVIDKVPLPMKFYGTKNELFFEKVSSTNSYKAFAICEDCLFDLLTGMRYVENNYSYNLFDLDTFVIPYENNEDKFNPKLYDKITKILGSKNKYKNDIELLKQTLNKANRKNLFFNLLFYHHPESSQQFEILKLISNIELNNLLRKLTYFDQMTELYKLDIYIAPLTLNNIRYYLFPSYYSHKKKPDYKIFGKDLVNFLESFLTDKSISYFNIIKNFKIIFKKLLNNGRYFKFSAFEINLFLTILFKLNQLRKGDNMNNGNIVTDVLKKDYSEFFKIHENIYGNNAFKQGLFLLGTRISRIIKAQKDKNLNFLKKLNLSGESVRRVLNLVNKVKEYEDIYKKEIFQESDIWGNIMDRLQGIEKSDLTPDEVIFYILSGISYEDYLGVKYGRDKKLKQDIIEGEE